MHLQLFEDESYVMEIAVWARYALDGADFMEERGAIAPAHNLRNAVDTLLVMSAEIVGSEKLAEAMFEVIKARGETFH